MQNRMICPYFRRDDEECDVGFGYISPHDVQIMSRFCSSHYLDCLKYRQLTEKGESGEPALPALPEVPTRPAAVISDRKEIAMFPADDFSEGLPIDTPAPLGVLLFGLTILLLNLFNAGFFPLSPLILGGGILYGGIGQILAGMTEWRRNQPFGAAAFIAFGLFWLSLVGLTIFPHAGFGKVPAPIAMVSYLSMWGIFTLFFFLATFRLNRALQLVFGGLLLNFILLIAAYATELAVLHRLAAYVGILCGVAAVYTGAAQGFNQACGREVAPLGATRRS